ncbi:MAG: hypothetical protein IPQ08_09230 [Chitinophagaceae bacterium]|nr:hypothetical protein [Chitinophagaceae bacterium]
MMDKAFANFGAVSAVFAEEGYIGRRKRGETEVLLEHFSYRKTINNILKWKSQW